MASTVVSESKVHPRLSLSLEPPASASPFPSPSSSFLPPPMPGAHEFAVKPPPGRNPRTGKGHARTISGGTPAGAGTPTDGKAPRSALSSVFTAAGEGGEGKVNGGQTNVNANTNGSTLRPDSESPGISPSTPTPSLLQMHALVNGSHPVSNSAYPPTPSGLYPPSPSDLAPGSSIYPPTPIHPADDTAYPPTPTAKTDSGAYPKTPMGNGAPGFPTVVPATPEGQEPLGEGSIVIPSPPLTPTSCAGPTSIAAANPATDAVPTHTPSAASLTTATTADPTPAPSILPTTTPAIHRLSLTGLSTPDPTRPAPPSPALSRRTSQLPPGASNPPSPAMSRQASQRRPGSRPGSGVFGPSRQGSLRRGGSPAMNPKRWSTASQGGVGGGGGGFSPLPSPQASGFPPSSFSPPSSFVVPSSRPLSSQFPASSSSSQLFTSPLSAAQPATSTAPTRTPLKVRDFAFPPSDERHLGLGPDVPKPNRVGRLNRRLGAATSPNRGSWTSSDGDGEDDGDDGDDGDGGWDGFRMGMGRFKWNIGAQAGAQGGPTQDEVAMNFLDDNEVYYYDDDETPVDPSVETYNPASPGEFNEEEEPLYPGLYRALYAFEPEGTAEMGLEEDQVVRVVGRGGGVGWAVVVDEREREAEEGEWKGEVKHALVPESYLEAVRLDVEDED